MLRKEGVSDAHSAVHSESDNDGRKKRIIMDAFQDFIHLEKDLDRMKVEITLREDYNLIDAFGLLDS